MFKINCLYLSLWWLPLVLSMATSEKSLSHIYTMPTYTHWYCSPRALSSGRTAISLSTSPHTTDTPIPWWHLWSFAGLDPECPFLSYKEDSISNVSQQCLLEEKGDIPWAAGSLPTYVAQDPAALQHSKDTKVKISKDISCLNNHHTDRRLGLMSFKYS